MPYAATLLFDRATCDAMAAVWQALAGHGHGEDRLRLGYDAHVTLAVWGDEAPEQALRQALETVSRGWGALPCPLAGLGLFTLPERILWAAPAGSPALLARHSELLTALPPPVPAPHAHYRLGAWVPHVTLSGPLTDPAGALAAVLPLWRPAPGAVLRRTELVRFRPVEPLWGRDLAHASRRGRAP